MNKKMFCFYGKPLKFRMRGIVSLGRQLGRKATEENDINKELFQFRTGEKFVVLSFVRGTRYVRENDGSTN